MLDFQKVLSGVGTGTLDAKSEVFQMIKRMTPQQRKAAMGLVPQVEAMAQQTGISTAGFKDELSAQLK